MNAQEMLELIERQEKLLRDALAQLGDAKRHLRDMMTVTTTYQSSWLSQSYNAEAAPLDQYRKQGIQ